MMDINKISVFREEFSAAYCASGKENKGGRQKTAKTEDPYYRAAGDVMDFFETTATEKYGCEFRDGQYDMALEIIEALKQGDHYVTEAGVGIGKSYGYLVPLVLLRKYLHQPVCVATSTIALQEQLVSDVRKLSDMLGEPCDPVTAKGQTHYLCMERLVRFLNEKGIGLDIGKDGMPSGAAAMAEVEAAARDIRIHENGVEAEVPTAYREDGMPDPLLTAIKKGAEAGCGERKEFPFEIPDELWSDINISAYNPGNCRKRCPYVKNCPYHKMRANLLSSDFIICNQDLLTRHFLNVEKPNGTPILNPAIKAVVVDEAHNLEGKVRSAMTVSYTKGKLLGILDSATRSAASKSLFAMDIQTEKAREAIGALFRNMEMQRKDQVDAGRAAGMTPGYADRYFFRDVEGAYALLQDVTDAYVSLAESLDLYFSFQNYRGFRKGTRALDSLSQTADILQKLCEGMDSRILWICQGPDGMELSFCPKDTAAISNRLFFSGKHRMILTSATLTGSPDGGPEKQYAYLKSSLGLAAWKEAGLTGNGELSVIPVSLGEPKQSPYDYDSHAMVYYAGDMPHPSRRHRKFVERGTKRLMEILDISQGRALVLFTSKTDLDEVAAELKRQKTPYNILMQKAGASQAEVLKQFREDVNSVLLGTGAFWEGVSIEGESLSNVVIFRLPFPVPDPIIDYKCSIAKDRLMDVLVPEMVIKLKQGVGRLIRNATDKGIISIIDGRMGERSDAKYKQAVWDALPIKNRTSSLKKIREFYENVVLYGGTGDGFENAASVVKSISFTADAGRSGEE